MIIIADNGSGYPTFQQCYHTS